MITWNTIVEAVGLKKKFSGLPAGAQSALMGAMTTIGQGLERHVKVNKLGGQALKVRTGNLRRAVFHRVGVTNIAGATDVYVVVGVDLRRAPYGRIHELGGTITPKKSKYLTIPLKAARTANGVARFTARDLIANPGSFGYTGTFFRNAVLFGKKGKSITPLFALKTSVKIKAVGYLKGTVAEKRPWAVSVVQQAVQNWVQK